MYEGMKEHLLEKKRIFYRHDKTLLKKKKQNTQNGTPKTLTVVGAVGSPLLPSIFLEA